jgi:membrane fusion protein (multidrug efflux system)
MKKNKKFILAGFAVLLLLAAVVLRIVTGGSSADNRKQPAPLVKVERPKRENVNYTLQFTGDMVAVRQATIFSKVSGNLERVYVDMGSKVQSGQLLALIDTTELRQQYQQAAATYQNARMNYQRTNELSEQNLVAKQEIDNSEAAMKVAKANYDLAATKLSYARITAPFAGYITKRYLDPGALVNPGNTTLFMLMDLDEMKVIVNILEKDIPLITIGKKAVVTVDAFPDKQFFGTVIRFSQAVDLSTRTMAVEIDIANKDHTLKPGMFANVTLLVDEHKNALTLPTQAISKDDNGSYVFAAVNDTAKKLRVTIGTEQNSRTEILKGLDGSENIISTGQQFVKDNGPVSIQSR